MAREMRESRFSFDELRRETMYALRGFRRSPLFAIAAVLTLALGVGVNAAIFSVVNALLLRPLPYHEADRLVRVLENVPAGESSDRTPSRRGLELGEALELQQEARTLADVAFYQSTSMTLTARQEATRLDGVQVSPGLFRMLGATALFGRPLQRGDETPVQGEVVVLSHSLWQGEFAGESSAIGATATLDGRPYLVVGVMPQSFAFPDPYTQFWVPSRFAAAEDTGRISRAGMLARLADGTPMAAATTEINLILHRFRGFPPPDGLADSAQPRFELVRVQDELVEPIRPALWVLTVAVGFVLLIACANVANLLLARTAGRAREIAIRVALGASRARLMLQSMIESLLLALAGGVLGTLFAGGGIALLKVLGSSMVRRDLGPGVSFPRLDEVGLDVTAFAFGMGLSLLTGAIFGLVPALLCSRSAPAGKLRQGSTTAGTADGGLRGGATRGALVVGQTALALLLLVAGLLLMRSFVALSRIDPGYEPTNVLTFKVALPQNRYTPDRIRTFAQDLVARLQLVPQVQYAAYAGTGGLPMVRDRLLRIQPLRLVPEWPAFDPNAPRTGGRVVSRDYLKVMGMKLVAGREFDDRDATGRSRAILINEALARRDFPGENPIGKRVYSVGDDPVEIVGIVGDVRQIGLDLEPRPEVMIDFRQTWPIQHESPLYYAVRTEGDPLTLVPALRRVIRQIDPEAAPDSVATMERLVSNSISRPRMYAVLLGVFAMLAVILAAIGIYGVTAYWVTQRTREIGIRMAMGARRTKVLGLILREGAALVASGLLLGLAGAFAVTGYLEGMLFGVTRLDPATLTGAVALFGVVGFLASFIPARRATAVDPLIALRCE